MTIGKSWIIWDGNYEKVFYDIKLPDGTVYTHCWPNAGRMYALSPSGKIFDPDGQIEIRVSDYQDGPP
jgi:hypothetical protein